jgi:hypothetical protein
MSINLQNSRELLKSFQFRKLFIEELQWANPHIPPFTREINGARFRLTPIAEQGGMYVFEVAVQGDGMIPNRVTRLALERQITPTYYEHLLIFVNAARTVSRWLWVKRGMGKHAPRERGYDKAEPGDLLLQKLQGIAFRLEDLDENGRTTIGVVTDAMKHAFDVERVTKRFYDEFKTQRDTFARFIKGIEKLQDRDLYCSVMLDRLMFIYFIQKKCFLNDDENYLTAKLAECRTHKRDYYRDFLRALFFEGLARKDRSQNAQRLLGTVPYLNGGLFLPHQIEKENDAISIPDSVFDKLFKFFERYDWHLEPRGAEYYRLHPDAKEEISPDVLGYIFEKYINQKQMGAYYTKEDITEYISKNTIIPFIFDAAAKKEPSAFKGEQSVWVLLQQDPDRYIFDAVKKGNDLALPPEIQAGENDVSKRGEWNKPAPEAFALPTEIWREVIARRARYADVRAKLAAGEIHTINDLITYNLDIRRFAEDVIQDCASPELLRAFWHAIERISVLDPTVGSGAFLFAALNILYPLYEACLRKMQEFVDDLDASGEKHSPKKFEDFRAVLARVKLHPNRAYFILKSIILNNLYGVDIMPEAVEICKLRLFLKLVAQVEKDESKENLGIEPLPDIDFNVRAGNTLIGFATYEDVKRAVTSKLDFENAMERIEEKAQGVDELFELFRQQQTKHGGEVTAADKQELRDRLKALEDELNQHLAGQYGKDAKSKASYEKWLSTARPFHWFVEFHGIIKNGGFDAIIGNPPYVEYSQVKKEYTAEWYATVSCGNLYAFVIERCFDILRQGGLLGMIVQLPIVCTDRMKPLQKECIEQSESLWFANFDDRPAKLFDGLQHIRASIFTSKKGNNKTHQVLATTYNRWYTESRPSLFEVLVFESVSDYLMPGSVPKIGHPLSKAIRKRIDGFAPLGKYLTATFKHAVHFHNSPQYWIRAMTFVPYFWNERGGEQTSSHVKAVYLPAKLESAVVVAVLNSTLFYWWFILLSNCRDLVSREIETFPIGLDRMTEATKTKLAELTTELMADYKRHAVRKETEYQTTGKVVYDEFYPRYSKPIIDKIDHVLAKHYGFTDEELDFIINYDIKYRMGKDAEGEEEEE